MLTGSYAHSLDAKGRLVLPARFRASLGLDLFVTKGLHGCLWVFGQDDWQQLVAKLTSGSMVNPEVLALQRFFLGFAADCHPDDVGRVSIPELLRQYAGIQRDVITIGAGNRLEIWALERWEAYNGGLTDDEIQRLGQKLQL
jgi:MraZ protein